MPNAPRTRRTKIVATIGPASDDPVVLAAMVAAGMDMARVTLAHGAIAEAIARIRRIRQVSPTLGILADLPGPKVRAAPFPDDGVQVMPGEIVRLVAATEGDRSHAHTIGVIDEEVVAALMPGDRVALGDGGVVLLVTDTSTDGVSAEVQSGGRLLGKPGVSVPGSRMSRPSPTADDLERLAALVEADVDAVAVSFVRSAADMHTVRAAAGKGPMLVAKIETPEAVENLEAIVAASDGVMVARGDLGVRLPYEDVPHIQKRIIKTGVRFGRPVITATQMLESMVSASAPTRAEVTDVANAVLDGTSAVMLSAETAVGHDPVAVVRAMATIAARAEREFDFHGWASNLGAQEVADGPSSPAAITAATTGAAWRAAIETGARTIIACTRSGATARDIARFRPELRLLAATPSVRTARQLSMSWGTEPLLVGESSSTDDIVWFAVQAAVAKGALAVGDIAVVLAGSPTEPEPATDTLRIVRVR